MALAGAAESDSLIDGDVAADDGGLSNDDAGCVINEKAAANERAGVDVDAGVEAGDLGKHASGETKTGGPERVRDAMEPDGPEAGIAEKDFEPGTRCGVALHYGADVFADAFKRGHGLQGHNYGWGRRDEVRTAGRGSDECKSPGLKAK